MDNAYDQYTDDALLSLWKEGKILAFEIFCKRNFFKLANIATQKTRDYQLSEELAQDALFLMYKNSRNIKNNPLAYCYTIIQNKIINLYHKKRLKIISSFNDDVRATDSGYYGLEQKEMEKHICKQIESLPEQCQKVFLLKREANLTNQQIAQKLGISIKTVENHMTKAHSILKEKLEHHAYIIFIIGLSFFS